MHVVSDQIPDLSSLVKRIQAPGNNPIQPGPYVCCFWLWDNRLVVAAYRENEPIRPGETTVRVLGQAGEFQAIHRAVDKLLATGQSFITDVDSDDARHFLRWTLWTQQTKV